MPKAAVFWHFNSALIGLVGAIVQGATEPLLVIYAVNIWSFLLAKLLYCFAVLVADGTINSFRAGQQINQENHTQFWGFVAFVFGSLSSVSLISTFVSRCTGHIILCVAWICAAIIIAVYRYGRLFIGVCRSLYHETLKPFFIYIWNRIQGNNMVSETEQPRPAV